MKILIDCRYVRIGRHDGISRFTAELVAEMAKNLPIELLINDKRQLKHLPENLKWHLISGPTNWREPIVARQINALHPDIVFSPMQTMGSIGRKYQLVLTLHDLIYYRNPTPPRDLPAPVRGLWRLFHMAWWPQRVLLNRSDHVVTVSNASRDLIKKHRLTKRPITVVYNGASPLPTDDTTYQRKKSLVYMGSFMPYKNVETLAKATELLPGYELHLLSKISDQDRSRIQAAAPNANVIFHNGVTDSEYATELRQATALVSASHDEGFGIPLVEAMSLGIPVVVSDIPVFREVAGECGRYVAADDATGFAKEIIALEEDDRWQQLSAEVKIQAKKFNWKSSSQVLENLLTKLASKP